MSGQTVKVKINPELISWARKTAGFTIADIARFFKKTEQAIASWENGKDMPTIRQLEKLANKLKRPLALFFLPKPPKEPAQPKDFRVLPARGAGVFDPSTLIAFRSARAMAADVEELLYLSNRSLVNRLPRFTLRDNLESKAIEFRTLLGVSVQDQVAWVDAYEALDTWRRILFNMGVIVFVLPLQIEDVRAFSMEIGDVGVIGLSTKEVFPAARCFSLFHEVCHLCIGKPGVSGKDVSVLKSMEKPEERVEAFCDRFSASFLLPKNEPLINETIKNLFHIHRLPERESTVREARILKVSKYVLLRRGLDLGYLSANDHWKTYKEWHRKDTEESTSKREGGGSHLRNRVSALGKQYVSLVFEALDNKRISIHDASEYLNIQPGSFEKTRVIVSKEYGGI